MEEKKKKKQFNIDENISNEQIYALLDNVNGDNEGEMDNFINNSDTKFIANEETLPAKTSQQMKRPCQLIIH